MEKTINFNLEIMGSSDIDSMHLIINAYRDLDYKEDIDIMHEGTGFNTSSGYVYIALENGITIASCFGQSVEYIVTDFEDGEEFFYNTYQEATEKIEELV